MDASGVIIKENAMLLANLWKGMDFIRHTEVLVGIPQENSAREEGPLTNAELMYLHTNGSPVKHIPARPVIEPALAEPETAIRIRQYLIQGMRAATTGNIKAARACYEKAGLIGANAAKKYFTSGNLAPNSPLTIKMKGSSRPLIDTGALRQSITYVVRRNGGFG